MTVIWFGNRFFVDVIKLRWGPTGGGWAQHPTVDVLIRRPCEDRETHREKAMWGQRQRLEWCIYQPRKTQDCWQPPDAGREAGQSSLRPSERAGPCWLAWYDWSAVWYSTPFTPGPLILTTVKTERPFFAFLDISEDWGSSSPGPCPRGVATSESGPEEHLWKLGSGEGYKHQSDG